MCVCACVHACVFKAPPAAKVMETGWQPKISSEKTGEARDQTDNPLFTMQVVYPLHHSSSYF